MTEDRILDFLDGRLSGAEEEELLHTLAVSPEHRLFLKQHMMLRELTNNLGKEARYAVPCSTTAALFEKLTAEGYAGPGAITPSAPLLPTIPQVVTSQFRFRLVSLVTSSVVSFLLGLGVYYISQPAKEIASTEQPRIPVTTFELPMPAASDATQRVLRAKSGSAVKDLAYVRVEKLLENARESVAASSVSTPKNARIDKPADAASNNQSIVENAPENETPIAAIPALELKNSTSISNNSSSSAVNASTVKEPVAENPEVPVQNSVENNAPVATRELAIPVKLAPIESVNPQPSSFRELDYASLRDLNNDPKDDGTGFGFKSGFRMGAGYAPGSPRVMSGSLLEGTATLRYGWLSLKASWGQFMPYEPEIYDPNPFPTAVRTLDFLQALKFKSVYGAELGVTIRPYNVPIEFSGGFLMENGTSNIYPRGGLLTTFDISRHFQVDVGLEGVLYTVDTRKVVERKHEQFRNDILVILHQPGNAVTGFIGPTFNFSYRL